MGAAAWGNGDRLTNPYYKRLRQYFYFGGRGKVFTNNEMLRDNAAAIRDIVGPFLSKERLWDPDAVLNVDDIRHSPVTRERVDQAAAVQMVFEDALFHKIDYLIRSTGGDKLVMCGGTALNCVANMRLLDHFNLDYYRGLPGQGNPAAPLDTALPRGPGDGARCGLRVRHAKRRQRRMPFFHPFSLRPAAIRGKK